MTTSSTEIHAQAQQPSSFDLDATLDAIMEESATFPVVPISDERAARMNARLGDIRKELKAGHNWWASRRSALKRAEDFLSANLATWARAVHRATGLKTFPCGTGKASLRKASAKVEWDDAEARPWLVVLALEHPDLMTGFDLPAVLRDHVEFAPPDERGLCEATLKETGEILPGLWKNLRPGELTCSVNPGE